MLVSGGGAKNPTLVAMIARAVAPIPVRAFADRYFDGEAKEAVAFALLAYLHLDGQPGERAARDRRARPSHPREAHAGVNFIGTGRYGVARPPVTAVSQW